MLAIPVRYREAGIPPLPSIAIAITGKGVSTNNIYISSIILVDISTIFTGIYYGVYLLISIIINNNLVQN